MAKYKNNRVVEPIYKVDRFYDKGQETVSGYIISLRVGNWTEDIKILVDTHWGGRVNIEGLKLEIQAAKKSLWEKYELFAVEFPEVDAYGEKKIGAEIRQRLELPALESGTEKRNSGGTVITSHETSYGQVA